MCGGHAQPIVASVSRRDTFSSAWSFCVVLCCVVVMFYFFFSLWLCVVVVFLTRLGWMVGWMNVLRIDI